MASYLYFNHLTHDGPFALRVSKTASGGTWTSGTRSFALVAWDDPNELDWDRARIVNLAPNLSSAGYHCEYNGLSIAANDKLTFSFTPCRHKPHHYTLYVQNSATFDWDVVAQKVQVDEDFVTSAAGGNIPPHVTTFDVSSADTVQELRQLPLGVRSTTDWEVDGNVAAACYDGLSARGRPSGSVFTFGGGDPPRRTHRTRNEGTVISGTGLNTTDTHLEIQKGPAAFDGIGVSVVMTRIRNFSSEPTDFTFYDYRGRLVRLEDARNSPDSTVLLQIAYSSFFWFDGNGDTSAAGNHGNAAIYQINKWKKFGTLLELRDVSELNEVSVFNETWIGRIVFVNEPGASLKHNAANVQIVFKIEEVIANGVDVLNLAIITADAGTRTLTVDGDATADLVEDAKIAISGSTANDSLYAVESATYDYATNTTTIVVKNELPSSTADGRVELWDRP